MKGTVIDFDVTTNKGLILGEDGLRYSFNIQDWESKNKTLEIDIEVDFITSENQAKNIYGLNKNNLKNSNDIQDKTFGTSKLHSDIKKIDFERIDFEGNVAEELYESNRKSALKMLIISIGIGFVSFILMAISAENKYDFLLFIFVLVFLGSIVGGLTGLFVYLVPKKILMNMIKKDNIRIDYRNKLKIINFTPSDLKFDSIEIIHVSDKTIEGATNKLIRRAFELKADAIINYNQQVNTASNISTSNNILSGDKNIHTKIQTTYNINGLAIKVVE